MELDTTTGQPVQTAPSSGDNQPPENKTYTVNGKEVTAEALIENYNSLQSEFTKKSQKLSEYEKSNTWEQSEVDKTKAILKDMGFTTKDELEDFKKFQSDIISKEEKAKEDKVFDDFSSKFNTLTSAQKGIIKDLKKLHTEKDYNDVLKMTGFIDQSLLEKSKTWMVMGWDNIWLTQPKEIQSINPKIAKRMNLKDSGKISDIRNKFNI